MRHLHTLAAVAALWLFSANLAPTHGANITWIAGDGTWTDGGSTANWNPADEPDSNDIAIFNTNVLVTLGSGNTVAGVTMSASSELNLDVHTLAVSGATTLSGSGTRLLLDGGVLNSSQAISTGTLASLAGNGDVNMLQVLGAVTTLIDNNATLSATNPTGLVIVPPPAATLHITAVDNEARIDLDGSLAGETGVVSVGRNQTLDVDLPLADIFNGDVTMSHDSKLDISTAWILGLGGVVDIDNGATGGIGGIPAGNAIFAGAAFSQNDGTVNVLDGDGTLQFDAPFSMNGGTLANNGLVVFNATANIAVAANFTMPAATSSITVRPNRTANINQNNFNLDGANTATNVITVEAGAALNVTTTDYDPDSATNAFDGTIHLDDGDISVTTADAEFVMDGVLNMDSTVPGQIVAWTGEPFDLGNDAGSLDADLNVTGTRQSQLAPEVDFNADADVDVAAGATLALLNLVNFNTVNGGNNAQFTGAGTIAFSGPVNVNEAVTLNMVGGEVDLDGLDNTGDLVNIDAPLTINAATMSSFGRVNAGGVNTLDVNNSIGTGVLTVNLDNAAGEWTLNAAGQMNLVNDNTDATLLAGADVNVNGTVNVTGDVRTTARWDVGATAVVNINTAGQPLRLAGGDSVDVNTISGGTIAGAGLLGADTGKALHGYGTISADVDFDVTANLKAAGGTLTLSGDIVDVNVLGTADNAAVLNIPNAWETDGGAGGSIGAVVLAGGVLQGGVITNDNATGIQGFGSVTARVINTSKISATNGGTLVLQTSGNNNDWDGAADTGDLEALSGDLHMIDTTMPVPPVRQFGGTVRAINDNLVFADGFALDFNPGSSLQLEDEATYRADSSTDLGGTVTVAAGADATLQVANNFFLTFESGSAITLDGDLSVVNNNINIEDGATFTGAGALIVPDGSHMVIDNLADVGVLLEMQGALRPGNFNGIGRVNLFDAQFANSAELYVEIIGTSLNAFDRLVATGDVIADGYLNIDIDEISPGVPFVPALGNTFNIITGNSVTGRFDFVDVSGMPAGLAMRVNYLLNAVQLQVVNKPIYSADFDEDGDVDFTDLSIWKGAYDLNQLGDADGDNDSDGADFLLWQRQLGSIPALPVAAAVPEPASAVLALTLTAAVLARRRRPARTC